jgi:hemin uptake protein HemP
MSTDRCSSDPSSRAAPDAASNSQPPAPAAAGQANTPPVWHSEQLLGSHVEVLIVHQNEVYRLRRTRQGKLILYK